MTLNKSNAENIAKMLIDIQMALNASNNTVTTDDLDAQVDEMHWRINHTEEIKKIDEIANILAINLCSDPRCNCDNNSL